VKYEENARTDCSEPSSCQHINTLTSAAQGCDHKSHDESQHTVTDKEGKLRHKNSRQVTHLDQGQVELPNIGLFSS